MKLNFWKAQKRDDDAGKDRGGGLRRQTQVRRNLDQPAEEEPETIERAVRRDEEVENAPQVPPTKTTG